MATSPIDKDSDYMQEQFGTRVLITDLASERYLEKARKENAKQKKFTEFCGGKNGWNDYTERWH